MRLLPIAVLAAGALLAPAAADAAVSPPPPAGAEPVTDEIWLIPQLGLDPAGQELGTVDPATAITQQRSWLLRFFDRYVR